MVHLRISPEQEVALKGLTVFQLESRYPDEYQEIKKRATLQKTKELFNFYDDFRTWIQKQQ